MRHRHRQPQSKVALGDDSLIARGNMGTGLPSRVYGFRSQQRWNASARIAPRGTGHAYVGGDAPSAGKARDKSRFVCKSKGIALGPWLLISGTGVPSSNQSRNMMNPAVPS